MPTCQIIQRGVIEHTSEVDVPAKLFGKFEAMCKRRFQESYWADHYRAMKRRLDPEFVILRSSRRRSTDLVLINLDQAPSDYMRQLAQVYSW